MAKNKSSTGKLQASGSSPSPTTITPEMIMRPTPNVSLSDSIAEEFKLPLKAANYMFFCFLLSNLLAAFLMPISDCDETFNYWEPTHLILYGKGLQTWEYSPVFALRSYLYVWIHVLMGKIAMLLGFTSSVEVFYGIRIGLAVVCALSQTVFTKGIYERFGSRITLLSILVMMGSPGMFISSTAYLPSAFSMYMLMFAFGNWYSVAITELDKKMKWFFCVFFVGSSVIIGWPFSVVCGLPIAIDTIHKCGFWRTLKYAIVVSVVIISSTMAIDYYYYKKIFFTPLNLVMYNKGQGSEKFGVEPWHFYTKNLILNFNLAFVLALLTPFLVLIHYLVTNSWEHALVDKLRGAYMNRAQRWTIHYRWIIFVSPFYVWFLFFSSLPHKEERFMFVVYPLICLASAIGIELILRIIDMIIYKKGANEITIAVIREYEEEPLQRIDDHKMGSLGVKRSTISIIIAVIIVGITMILGMSRSIGNVKNFHAPLKVYSELHSELTTLEKNAPFTNKTIPVNVCVGKEWYRYPSSFFLPTSKKFDIRIRFLKSGFSGLLPKYFADENPTSSIPTGMNDENREEMDRYIPENKCHYIVDFDIPDQKEESFNSKPDKWTPIFQVPFLDANNSPALFRSFYIPFYNMNKYGNYTLFTRKIGQEKTKE
ncbi:hypothetical protein C9374_008734 [Naegleria lovaniensis]|uniref:Mannosyltransferase n=1 Tax=Naegleria lovaniensis TaxID=51637 RepID=A0AA88GER6_NAELO|nr:uncharacterized protein C9374_008734 [Naegleria lovaniensis]KAG2378112.1 hypothetical protein C9374_008734 [Naegleria lovaniensis]